MYGVRCTDRRATATADASRVLESVLQAKEILTLKESGAVRRGARTAERAAPTPSLSPSAEDKNHYQFAARQQARSMVISLPN